MYIAIYSRVFPAVLQEHAVVFLHRPELASWKKTGL